MCKSGLAIHIALSAAAQGYRVGYWSGEMTAKARLEAAHSRHP
jgi:hypothetical protein